ncbi:L-xylulose reductase [Fragariocoptes setiger]|uniref:L-xylulose reductase n=1 Tax=Fragariocoptes setiger TaxID=1670756 RepID=A0ABQ7SBT7_9ACAR|nr:L-xylulose reductase [Fragariocoptes setiger]
MSFSLGLKNMNVDFSGKTALITGAGQGIGNALVTKLVECKANVIAVSRTQSRLDELKQRLPQIEIICCDLGNWNETRHKLSQVCDSVDMLVNNAAFAQGASVGKIEEQLIDKHINVNVKAPINLMQLVGEGMRKRGKGSIVNVSSVAGVAALDDHTVYAATKAALDMITRVGAKEWGRHNIRVNSINPTVVWTEMGRAGWSRPEKSQEMLAKIPMNRFVEVEEVVYPIIFLLSDYSSMINGIQLPIDGGFLAN